MLTEEKINHYASLGAWFIAALPKDSSLHAPIQFHSTLQDDDEDTPLHIQRRQRKLFLSALGILREAGIEIDLSILNLFNLLPNHHHYVATLFVKFTKLNENFLASFKTDFSLIGYRVQQLGLMLADDEANIRLLMVLGQFKLEDDLLRWLIHDIDQAKAMEHAVDMAHAIIQSSRLIMGNITDESLLQLFITHQSYLYHYACILLRINNVINDSMRYEKEIGMSLMKKMLAHPERLRALHRIFALMFKDKVELTPVLINHLIDRIEDAETIFADFEKIKIPLSRTIIDLRLASNYKTEYENYLVDHTREKAASHLENEWRSPLRDRSKPIYCIRPSSIPHRLVVSYIEVHTSIVIHRLLRIENKTIEISHDGCTEFRPCDDIFEVICSSRHTKTKLTHR